MKSFLSLLLIYSTLNASVYYAKLEPLHYYEIKSSVNGKVVYANEAIEGHIAKSKYIIKIDDFLAKNELKSFIFKEEKIQSLVELNKQSLKNLNEILKRKEKNYKRIINIKTKPSVEKDKEYYDILNMKNSINATEEKIQNFNLQLSDISFNIKRLKKEIKDKNIVGKGLFVDKLYVKKGDYVSPNTPILKLADLNGAKITLFLMADKLKDIRSKTIYINGNKTNAKIDKIWSVTDSVHISAYRTEILLPKPLIFSKVVKVEFK
jgi:hypothetical protein